MQNTAELIRKYLYNNSLTITEFARICDISRFTVYKYLSGGRIHPKTARKIQERIKAHRTLPKINLID